MSNSKIIAVVGATGAQGGGLAQAILDDPNSGFRVRAISRNPDSPKAKALAERGAEVVAADLDDPERLRKVFEGAYGAFLVTNFWEHFSPEKEYAQAANMAKAAKEAGIQHAVWSTLEDTRKWVPLESDQMPTLMEKYKVPHFDGKGAADELFTEAGVPTTFLLTSFYWDNFIHFGMGPQPGPDGKLAITFPLGDKKLAGIAAADIGHAAYGIFKRPELIGKTVGIAGGFYSGEEMALILSEATGTEVAYNSVPPEVYRGFGFPGADDLGNMFQFKRDFNDDFLKARNLEFSRQLHPGMQDMRAWASAHREALVPK